MSKLYLDGFIESRSLGNLKLPAGRKALNNCTASYYNTTGPQVWEWEWELKAGQRAQDTVVKDSPRGTNDL